MPPREIPDLATIIGPLLDRVPHEQQPLLIAVAERRAAERYRGWADGFSDAERKAELLACAEREEDIATRVEALFPEAAAIQRDIVAKIPDLEEVNRKLFAQWTLEQQFTIQARGERLGAATWRSFAKRETDATARETYLECAKLEEASAGVLESILEDG